MNFNQKTYVFFFKNICFLFFFSQKNLLYSNVYNNQTVQCVIIL